MNNHFDEENKNKAVLHLNTSKDTSELACESLTLWWQDHDKKDYPGANKVIILCDGGDSNCATSSLFKENLQKLANRSVFHEGAARNQNFGLVDNAFVRVASGDSGEEIARYDLTEDYNAETSLIFGELYKKDGA